MGILKVYADIMDEVPKLEKDYKLSYDEALRRAKDIYIDELKKAQSLATKQGEEPMKPLQNIITDKEDIDNNEIYDIDSVQTIKQLI